MKKTIINTGGALAIAGLSAGLSICSNEAQAANCGANDMFNVLTGAAVDLSGAASLVNGITYVMSTATGCDVQGAITVPDSATVTIVDSTGFNFGANTLTLGKGATVNYFCNTGATCKVGLAGPLTSATFNVAGPAITLLAEGANADKITINAKGILTLTGPNAVTSTLAIPAYSAGVAGQVTLVNTASIPAKITATGKLISDGSKATTVTGK